MLKISAQHTRGDISLSVYRQSGTLSTFNPFIHNTEQMVKHAFKTCGVNAIFKLCLSIFQHYKLT